MVQQMTDHFWQAESDLLKDNPWYKDNIAGIQTILIAYTPISAAFWTRY